MKNSSLIQRKYLRRAKIVAYILHFAPFVRMVGLNGSLARGEAKESSDIDFLIIAKKGRIWTCRAFVTFLTHLTGHRRYGNKIAGRICLNRYQTDDFLDIQPHNEYHAKVFSSLIPLVDIDNTYEGYQRANKWMDKFDYPVRQKDKKTKRQLGSLFVFLPNCLRSLVERLFDSNWLEKKLKTYQEKRIKKDVRTKLAPNGRIRVSDKELCFHPIKD